ncbi:MAG: hypothetical protein ACTSV2_04255 [Candidatus Thorarchaeota archaeon]
MGETSRGAAKSLTEQRTNRMILVLSIGIVFTLAVGGFVLAANILGDQNQSPTDSQQKTVLDNFDLVETAQLQTMREIDFVLGSDSGEWVFDTEPGSITVLDYYIPEVMPLCLTQAEYDTWYVDLLVIGGYELVCGSIDVYQKGELVGSIYLDWYSEHGEQCCMDYYYITFFGDDICLESNQYPEVYAPFELAAPFETIPDKEAIFDLDTCWCGCCEPDQHFPITPTQLFLSFSKYFDLSSNDTNPITLSILSEQTVKLV